MAKTLQPSRTMAAPAVGTRKLKTKTTPGARRIRMRELPAFTRQLGAMLSSGMPVIPALQTVEDQTVNVNFRRVVTHVRSQIEAGAMLSEALGTYPDVFDELFVSMFRAGEAGGMLAETANRLAGYLENSAKLRRKVKSALMYPSVVVSVAILLTIGMMAFIVPAFADIYRDFDAELPGPTKVLVAISAVIKKYIVLVLAGLIAGVFAFLKFKKTPRGAMAWDGLVLRAPVFGELIRKVALTRFATTFAQLIKSGVPILRSMEIVALATGNKVLGKIILDSMAVVERGEVLSSSLARSREFPRVLVNMLAAGERTGRIDEMLQKVGEFYQDEVDSALAGLTSMIEPILMVFLGIVIGGIVICLFLPIFRLSTVVGV